MLLRFSVCALALIVTNPLRADDEHSSGGNSDSTLHPLSSKEEMIRDRFQRFQDRVFRLREQIAEKEPQNAARLGRALSQAGELELTAKLDALIKALRDPAQLPQTADAQTKWMEDADRLLNILLEQDSQNKERRDELDKLKQYQQKLNEILSQEQGLRNQSGETVEAKRMAAQLDQAIKRVEALIKRQNQLSQANQSQNAKSEQGEKRAKGEQGEKGGNGEKGARGESGEQGAKGEGNQGSELGEQQKDLAKDTERLAEDLKQLGEKPEAPTDAASQPQSSQLDAAKAMTQSASQSAQSGSQSMSQAGDQLSEKKQSDAAQSQKNAEASLEETKKQLEEAKNALQQKPSEAASGSEQRSVAQSTKSLSNQMQQDAQSSQGQQGKQGGKPGQSGQKSQSAKQQLDQAEKSMDDAAESLDKDSPEKAIPPQDDALDKLQEAKRELEEQIQKLRKEEKDETLRDLEARFRDMLSKQKPINDATASLNDAGRANFKRADELQLADMSMAQRGIAGQARTCLHILDEEGTTVAFPRVVNQLAEDMDSVAERLKGFDTGAITQTIEQEIVDTLTQLLDAVKKMQQENSEQAKSGGSQGGGDKNQPLLPPSAELKLLKASQVRINTRTTTIAGSLESGSEQKPNAEKGLKVLATRQQECMDIARQMKDKAEQP
ncbi:MAG: hypothetical protein HY287_11485 [Planctomycetes bacterium]|nr:hypothetical protein [Planctomycetota bacterium]MBI3834942.1 hypothetical protein [Planctomycetota bacterium]